MALTVNSNNSALIARASASSVNREMEVAMERLSTGKRINSAADDAAGVAIASRLAAEVKGTNQAVRNAMDAKAMMDTAEGAQIEITNILQRMRELSVQAANDSNNSSDRTNLQTEVSQLSDEIDRIAAATTFAGKALLNGTADVLATAHNDKANFQFQIGANAGLGQTLDLEIGAVSAAALGVGGSAVAPSVDATVVRADGVGTLKVEGNLITFGGKYNAGDTFAVTINGTENEIVAADEDAYTNDLAGLGAQMADTIRDTVNAAAGDGMEGATVVDNGDGTLSVFTAPSVTVNTTTETDDAAADDQTMVYNKSENSFTFGGTFDATDKYDWTINGVSIALDGTDDTDNYAESNAGVAANFVDLVNDESDLDSYGIKAVFDASSPLKVYLTQSAELTAATVTPLVANTNPKVAANATDTNVLDFTNAPSVGDTYKATINGVAIEIEISDGDNYSNTTTGIAQQFNAAVQAKIDDGTLIGVTTEADVDATDETIGNVTITQSASTIEVTDLSVVDTGGAGVNLTYEAAAGTLTYGDGNGGDFDHASGDSISFTINGVSMTVTNSTSDGFEDGGSEIAGLMEQVQHEINSNAELAAMGITAASVTNQDGTDDAKVTLAFAPKWTAIEHVAVADVLVAEDVTAQQTVLTVNSSSFATNDVITVDVEGKSVEVTINNSDSSVDNAAGVAGQIASAINAADIDGVTVTDNEDGTVTILKPSSVSVMTAETALNSITAIDSAIQTLNTQRATLGSVSNRLDNTVNNLTNVVVNIEASKGRIEDADFAAETTALARSQILQQASTAMLAQANASKQSVLSLLQG